MKEFFRKMGYKFQKIMVGRYGIDQLWRVLLIFYLIGIVIANIVFRFQNRHIMCYSLFQLR